MKKWIFATCALALALGASAANAKIATREWVYKQLKAGGVKVSTATVATNIVVESGGTVRTNYTVSSSFACSALPKCESITFVVSTGTITNRTVALARPSLLDLFISRAFADILPAETITATVRSGFWTDEDGDNHNFNLGDGLRLESSEELPAVPDATHTCEIGTDCNCKGASLTASTVEIPPEYQEISEETAPAWYDIYNWIDTASWQPQRIRRERADAREGQGRRAGAHRRQSHRNRDAPRIAGFRHFFVPDHPGRKNENTDFYPNEKPICPPNRLFVTFGGRQPHMFVPHARVL